jgi:predicted ATPase
MHVHCYCLICFETLSGFDHPVWYLYKTGCLICFITGPGFVSFRENFRYFRNVYCFFRERQNQIFAKIRKRKFSCQPYFWSFAEEPGTYEKGKCSSRLYVSMVRIRRKSVNGDSCWLRITKTKISLKNDEGLGGIDRYLYRYYHVGIRIYCIVATFT